MVKVVNNLRSSNIFSDFHISPLVRVSVVIPVKNEEVYIKKTLAAFAGQVDVSGNPLDPESFELLILANNCTDCTVLYINEFKKEHPSLNIRLKEITLGPKQANIGFVRKLLMEAAFERLSLFGGGIIMTTDGDTRVAKDWIAQTQLEIEKGAEAVGGRILFCPQELAEMDESVFEYHFKDETYRLLIAELEARILKKSHNPSPTHHQHFNGSFAVTTDCYARSGGVPDVAFLEDCAYFEKLKAVDARIRHSQKVKVYTSARYIGRTEVGLSYQLNRWKSLAGEGEDHLVESGALILRSLIIQAKLINVWKNSKILGPDVKSMLQNILHGFDVEDAIYESFGESLFFGKWFARLQQDQQEKWKEGFDQVPIDLAISELKKIIADYADASFSHTSIR